MSQQEQQKVVGRSPYQYANSQGKVTRHSLPKGFTRPRPGKFAPVITVDMVQENLEGLTSDNIVKALQQKVSETPDDEKPMTLLSGLLAAFKVDDPEFVSELNRNYFGEVFGLSELEHEFEEEGDSEKLGMASFAFNYAYDDSVPLFEGTGLVTIDNERYIVPDDLADMLKEDDVFEPAPKLVSYPMTEVIDATTVALVCIKEDEELETSILSPKLVTEVRLPKWYTDFAKQVLNKERALVPLREFLLCTAQKLNSRCVSISHLQKSGLPFTIRHCIDEEDCYPYLHSYPLFKKYNDNGFVGIKSTDMSRLLRTPRLEDVTQSPRHVFRIIPKIKEETPWISGDDSWTFEKSTIRIDDQFTNLVAQLGLNQPPDYIK